MQIPRPEYPRPQFIREGWMNLNGRWQFEYDNCRSGEARGVHGTDTALSSCINVPFCPKSKLSGISNTDFILGAWYKRSVTLEELPERTLLHFGAVDHLCRVYVNGVFAGEHKGGYVSFSFDISHLLHAGENQIAVYAEDDTRNGMIPSGKQSALLHSHGCHYTRTTGIWQTVWLEFMPKQHIEWVKYYPNISEPSVTVTAKLCGEGDLTCRISYRGKPMGSRTLTAAGGNVTFSIPLEERHLWEVGQGRLYDVEFEFAEDRVQSYFGLREVRLDGFKFLINGKSVFQRLVLDQGFYPDGIYTAPNDSELLGDIERSLDLGFNGARLHEKIFEERFLYHADRMGYIVWGEYPDWGLDHSRPENIYAMLPEWLEELQRDFNHPSIIGWCPHNETWDCDHRKQVDDSIRLIYETTKAVDPTRPCIDTSGCYHIKTDIYCVHDYDQNPESFKAKYDRLMTEGVLYDPQSGRQQYSGEAAFVSEYGGIAWNLTDGAWGYGKGPESIEDFYTRFEGLTCALMDNSCMFGMCYTQLTDVEQEQNGLYTYDRKAKFDNARLREILSRKAAIED